MPKWRWHARRLWLRWRPHTSLQLARGRWHLRHAEHLGRSPRIYGRPRIDTPRLRVGDDVWIWSHHRMTHFGGEGLLEIGNRSFVNAGVVIMAFDRVTIGDDVAIGSECFITDSDNHPLGDRPTRVAPVTIERGAWLATRAMVLPGVTIGERAVVAAGAVVVDDVPPDTLVAGVPAKVVRKLTYPPGRDTAWRDGTT